MSETTLLQKTILIIIYWPVLACMIPLAYVDDGRDGVLRIIRRMRTFEV
jgi:hypothetical protein